MKSFVFVLLIFLLAIDSSYSQNLIRLDSQIAEKVIIRNPGEEYGIDWGQNSIGDEVISIKFPETYSTRYNIKVIPNLYIQISKKEKSVDVQKELNAFALEMQKSPVKAVLVEGKTEYPQIKNTISNDGILMSYFDQKIINIRHRVLIILVQYRKESVRIIFDATDDIFEEKYGLAMQMIESLEIS